MSREALFTCIRDWNLSIISALRIIGENISVEKALQILQLNWPTTDIKRKFSDEGKQIYSLVQHTLEMVGLGLLKSSSLGIVTSGI